MQKLPFGNGLEPLLTQAKPGRITM